MESDLLYLAFLAEVQGGIGVLSWRGGVEELSRRSSLGAVGCRDGAVNQCALQKEGTFAFSADGRGTVWEMIAFFS